jgi:hypothetical protein
MKLFWNCQMPCTKQTDEIILELPNAMYQTNPWNYCILELPNAMYQTNP